jgi:hypothetical protein
MHIRLACAEGRPDAVHFTRGSAATLEAFEGTLIGEHRGLLYYWPFYLFCVLPAVASLAANFQIRGPVLLAVTVTGLYLLFNCSYYMWQGGASYGPRHLIPSLPFAAYLVVRSYQGAMRWLAPVMTAVIATMPEFPEPWTWPLVQFAFPAFFTGTLSNKAVRHGGLIEFETRPLGPNSGTYWDAWNLGEVLGLQGLLSLVPLLLLLLLLGGALAWVVARAAHAGTPR